MEREPLKFRTCTGRFGPMIAGIYVCGDKISHEIKIGQQVALETDEVTVLVRLKEIEGERYAGIIEGFENYIDESYNGYIEGDRIEFAYDQIQSCIP